MLLLIEKFSNFQQSESKVLDTYYLASSDNAVTSFQYAVNQLIFTTVCSASYFQFTGIQSAPLFPGLPDLHF